MNFKAYYQVRLFLYSTCNLCTLTLCTEACTVTHNNNETQKTRSVQLQPQKQNAMLILVTDDTTMNTGQDKI